MKHLVRNIGRIIISILLFASCQSIRQSSLKSTGGNQVSTRNFPSVVVLFGIKEDGKMFTGTGTIVNDSLGNRAILTAGHTLVKDQKFVLVAIPAREPHVSSQEWGKILQTTEIDDYIIPSWNFDLKKNGLIKAEDIALLELPPKFQNPRIYPGIRLGSPLLSVSSPVENIVVTAGTNCRAPYANGAKCLTTFTDSMDCEHNFCTVKRSSITDYVDSKTKISYAKGDSGSPIIRKIQGQFHVVGIYVETRIFLKREAFRVLSPTEVLIPTLKSSLSEVGASLEFCAP